MPSAFSAAGIVGNYRLSWSDFWTSSILFCSPVIKDSTSAKVQLMKRDNVRLTCQRALNNVAASVRSYFERQ